MPRWHFTRRQNLLFMNNERTRVTSDSFPAKKHMDRFVCRYFFPATQAVALTFPAHIVHDKPENIWKVSDILNSSSYLHCTCLETVLAASMCPVETVEM